MMGSRQVQVIRNPLNTSIALETGYANSNPQGPRDVIVDNQGALLIRQHLEEGAPKGYSFHLNIALVNEDTLPQRFHLRIHWAEEGFDALRDHLYLGCDSGSRWQMLPIRTTGGAADAEVLAPPGRHLLCVSPKFDDDDLRALLDRAGRSDIFECIDAGVSHQGRAMVCLRCGTPGGRKVLITTRAHGYETAGAYALSGWIENVLSSRASRPSHLDMLDVTIMPMINPDAVAAGNCCLAPTGVNFGNGLADGGARDGGAQRLAAFILNLKPDVYLDMHNYMHSPGVDDFRTPNAAFLKRFADVAPRISNLRTVWRFKECLPPNGYLMTRCHQKFGTIRVLTEFPWRARLPEGMKAHGAAFLDAFLSVAAEDLKSMG